MKSHTFAIISVTLGFSLLLFYNIQLYGNLTKTGRAYVKQTVRILFWDDYYTTNMVGRSTNGTSAQFQCATCLCEIVHDRKQWEESDFIWFDRRNKSLGLDGYLPNYHPNQQYWVIYSHEPVTREVERAPIPEGVFNLSHHYRSTADIPGRFGACKRRVDSRYDLPSDFLSTKTGLVLWHVSDCRTQSKRERYIGGLRRFISVDIFGSCSGKEFPNRLRLGMEDMPGEIVRQLNKYKFYLAFENSLCKDYITEKAFKILQDDVHVVPIVMGNASYADILPPGSYIDAGKYSPQQLAEYLTKLNQNDHLYREFFKSRHQFECSNYVIGANLPCKFCNAALKFKQSGKKKSLGKSEIDTLFNVTRNCYFP